jgi:hypothetical protein
MCLRIKYIFEYLYQIKTHFLLLFSGMCDGIYEIKIHKSYTKTTELCSTELKALIFNLKQE